VTHKTRAKRACLQCQASCPNLDCVTSVIDALAAQCDARSAVEVSLSRTMERIFASVYKGVKRVLLDLDKLVPLLIAQAETAGTLLFDG
jgi:hypothetical protein